MRVYPILNKKHIIEPDEYTYNVDILFIFIFKPFNAPNKYTPRHCATRKYTNVFIIFWVLRKKNIGLPYLSIK